MCDEVVILRRSMNMIEGTVETFNAYSYLLGVMVHLDLLDPDVRWSLEIEWV